MTLHEKRWKLTVTLEGIPDAQQRFTWLVEQGRAQEPLPNEDKVDAHRVQGCLAKLWLIAEFREGKCWFRCDSDSQIVRAVAGLLCGLYNGHPPDEILMTPPDFLSAMGIAEHLTANRRNALGRVWETIRNFAEKSGGAAVSVSPPANAFSRRP
jgi:cysteine desulfuration protein SufE